MIHVYLLCIPEWDADEWTELESDNMYDAASAYVAMSEGADPETEPESLKRPIEVHVMALGSDKLQVLQIESALVHVYRVVDNEAEEESGEEPEVIKENDEPQDVILPDPKPSGEKDREGAKRRSEGAG